MQNYTSYDEARKEAQRRANDTGISVGLYKNIVQANRTEYTQYNIMYLPKPENRTGWELKCEVVDPE